MKTYIKTKEGTKMFDTYEKLEESAKYFKNDWCEVIGTDTEIEKAIPVLNLHNCLMDPQQSFGDLKSEQFVLVQDLGLTECRYGNAGYGSDAYTGLYREIEILRNGNTESISFAIWGIERGYTSLCVGHSSLIPKVNHHALQYQIDKFLQIQSNSCRFLHNGRMSVGKIKDLRKYASQYVPHLLSGDEFLIGELKYDELYHLSSEDMTKFLTRLVEYALIRDDFQAYRKNNKDLFL